jgi:hypothetical protein
MAAQLYRSTAPGISHGQLIKWDPLQTGYAGPLKIIHVAGGPTKTLTQHQALSPFKFILQQQPQQHHDTMTNCWQLGPGIRIQVNILLNGSDARGREISGQVVHTHYCDITHVYQSRNRSRLSDISVDETISMPVAGTFRFMARIFPVSNPGVVAVMISEEITVLSV